MDSESDSRRSDLDLSTSGPQDSPSARRGARRKPKASGRPEIADPLGDFSEQTGAWF